MDIAELGIRASLIGGQRTEDGLNRIDNAADRAANSGGLLTQALKKVVIPAVTIASITSLVKVTADFEESLSTLSSITGATGNDLKFLSDAAKEFGATTSLSASQAADAFRVVASAKPELLDNLAALKATTKEAVTLAEASKMQLEPAANALAESLNQFGAGADQANRFINVLAAGSKFGSASISEMSGSLKNAGTVASTVGLSFEQTNATLQILSGAALKNSDAGTALKTVLLALSKSADSSINPSIVGMSAALKELKSRNLDLAGATDVFGSYGVTAGLYLTENADKLDTMTEKLTGTTIAQDQAKTNVDNLNGSLASLSSRFESLQITIGEKLLPVLRPLIDGLSSIIGFITDNTGLIASLVLIPPLVGGVALAFTGLTAAIAASGSVMSALVFVGIPALVTGIYSIGTAISAAAIALGPFKLAAATAFAGIAIGTGLYKNFKDIRILSQGLFGLIEKSLLAVQFHFSNAAIEIEKGFINYIGGRIAKFVGLIAGIGGAIAESLGIHQSKGLQEFVLAMDDAANGSGKLTNKQKELKDEFDKAKKAIDGNFKELVKYELGIEGAGKTTGKTTDKTKEGTEENKKHTDSLGELGKAAEKAADKVQGIWDNLNYSAATTGLDSYEKQLFDLNRALERTGKLNEEEIALELKKAKAIQDTIKQKIKDGELAKNGKEVIKNLTEELRLLKLSNEERAKAEFLSKHAEKLNEADLKRVEALYEQVEAQKKVNEAADDMREKYTKAYKDVNGLFNDFIGDLIDGTGSFKDSLKGLVSNLFSSNGDGGSMIGDLVSGLTGGSGGGGIMDTITGIVGGGGGDFNIMDTISGITGGQIGGRAAMEGAAGFVGPGSVSATPNIDIAANLFGADSAIVSGLDTAVDSLDSVFGAGNGVASALGVVNIGMSLLDGDARGAAAGIGSLIGGLTPLGPLGAFIGGQLAGFAADALGIGAQWETVNSGISRSISGLSASFSLDQLQIKDKGIFGTDRRIESEDISDNPELQAAFEALVQPIRDLTAAVGHPDLTGGLNNFRSFTTGLISDEIMAHEGVGSKEEAGALFDNRVQVRMIQESFDDMYIPLIDGARSLSDLVRNDVAQIMHQVNEGVFTQELGDLSQLLGRHVNFEPGTAAALANIMGAVENLDIENIDPSQLNQQITQLVSDGFSAIDANIPASGIQAVSDTITSEILDAIAFQAGDGDAGRIIEQDGGFFDTLRRAVNKFSVDTPVAHIESFIGSMIGLRDTFNIAGISTDNIAQKVIDTFGGIESATAKIQGFSDAFREVIEAQSDDLGTMEDIVGNAFDSITRKGLKIPKTAEGFVSLVQSIDMTAPGMRELSNELLTNSQVMADFYDQLESSSDIAASEAQALSDSMVNVESAFIGLGIEIPDTVDGFYELIRGLDITTESGLAAHFALLGIEEDFTRITEATEAANQSTAESTRELDDNTSSRAANTRRISEDTRKVVDLAAGLSSVLGTSSTIDPLTEMSSRYSNLSSLQFESADALGAWAASIAHADNDQLMALGQSLGAVSGISFDAFKQDLIDFTAITLAGFEEIDNASNPFTALLENLNKVTPSIDNYAQSILDMGLSSSEVSDYLAGLDVGALESIANSLDLNATEFGQFITNVITRTDALSDAENSATEAHNRFIGSLTGGLSPIDAAQQQILTSGMSVSEIIGSFSDLSLEEMVAMADHFGISLEELRNRMSQTIDQAQINIDSHNDFILAVKGEKSELESLSEQFINSGRSASDVADEFASMSMADIAATADLLGISVSELQAAMINTVDAITAKNEQLIKDEQAMRDSIKKQAEDAAKAGLASLKASVEFEKDSLTAAFEANKERLDLELETNLELARIQDEARKSFLEGERDQAKDRIKIFESISSIASSGAQSLVASNAEIDRINARRARDFIASASNSGSLPDADRLKDSISSISSAGNSDFSTFADFAFQQAVTSNQLSSIAENAESQKSVEELTLAGIEEQLSVSNAQVEQVKINHDELVGKAEEQHRASIAGLDLIYEGAVESTNTLLGIDGKMLSVDESLNQLELVNQSLKDVADAGISIQERSLEAQLLDIGKNITRHQELIGAIGGIKLEPPIPEAPLPPSSQEDMAKEIEGLRQEMAKMTYNVTKASLKTARTLEQWNVDGMPVERVL